jgi:hypothetical protein
VTISSFAMRPVARRIEGFDEGGMLILHRF